MQVTELTADGLKRQYKVVIAAGDIETRIRTRLLRLQQQVRLPGFRPGKAPLPLLKKQYGKSVMGEVLEEAVDEGAKKAVADHQLKPALRPQVELHSFDDGKDLEFTVGLELLPEVPEVDLGAISLTRLTADIDPDKVNGAMKSLANARQEFKTPDEARPSREGDRLVIDFAGAIDGAAFEGGSGTDFTLQLGSGSMVPGFEAQLTGVERGTAKDVTVTFPESYARKEVAGKEAVFAVTVKDLQEPQPVTVDDAWAKGLGTEGLDDLEAKLRERFVSEYADVSRARTKRALLDHLAATYRFEVPPGMVQMEFDAIWKQLGEEMERTGEGFGDQGEDEAKAEYRGIAERRVRLGLLLSDIGTRNEVAVESEELQRAVMREAMRFPGQERQVFDHFRNNPATLEQLRAPLFEDKVCDLIIARAQVSERKVTAEELMAEPDEPPPAVPAMENEA